MKSLTIQEGLNFMVTSQDKAMTATLNYVPVFLDKTSPF